MDINQAISENNIARVIELLDQGLNVNTLVGEYRTPILIKAVGTGNIDMVRLLIDRGADVNLTGDDMWHVLSTAAYNDYNEIIEILVDTGRISEDDIDKAINVGKLSRIMFENKFFLDCENGNIEGIKDALDQGMNINKEDENGRSF